VAQRLFQELLKWAGEKQLRRVYLGTTEKFLAAHRFHEKNGFLQIAKSDLPDSFPVMSVDTQGCSMLLNQFILRSFQIIGCADAFADISRRDT
jgi:N-acetylglutamate synthase-like GNAT family acetyltransferase